MPSNYTENYSLNQWSNNDQIKMEDFNADNARIDGALANKLGRATPLKTLQCPSNANGFIIPLSDTDWNNWEYIAIHCDMISSNPNMMSYKVGGQSMPTVSSHIHPCIIVLFPRHDSSRLVEVLILSYNTFLRFLNIPYSDCTSIEFSISGGFPKSNFTVYGF